MRLPLGCRVASGREPEAALSSANLLPAFGLISCLFALRKRAAAQTVEFSKGCKTLKWELEVIPLFSKSLLTPAGGETLSSDPSLSRGRNESGITVMSVVCFPSACWNMGDLQK